MYFFKAQNKEQTFEEQIRRLTQQLKDVSLDTKKEKIHQKTFRKNIIKKNIRLYNEQILFLLNDMIFKK